MKQVLSDAIDPMRKRLRNSEIRDIARQLGLLYGLSEILPPNARIDLIDNIILMVDDEPLFFRHDNRWAPTVKLLLRSNFLKTIIVDKGAVRFVTDGADIMRPGMIQIDDTIAERDFVAIVDETHNKPLAVGFALTSGNEMRLASKGKMIQNIHYVGDRIWNI